LLGPLPNPLPIYTNGSIQGRGGENPNPVVMQVQFRRNRSPAVTQARLRIFEPQKQLCDVRKKTSVKTGHNETPIIALRGKR